MRTTKAPRTSAASGGGSTDAAWSRGKLLTVLVGAATVMLALITGIALAVYFTVRPAGRNDTSRNGPSTVAANPSSADANDATSRQDQLAERLMPQLDLAAAEPGDLSARDPGTIVLPASTRLGPDEVPSGYPHTPAGALAQLAAIDQTAMHTGTLAGPRAVITDWAAPSGPTPSSWSAVRAMASLLDAAGLSGGGSPDLELVVTPLMGMIKGTVGTDFVVACVDFEFDATLRTTQRVAAADCQRMVWRDDPRGGRWVIGPGAEPAPAPSVWPDTAAAMRVGYRDLRHG